MLFFNFVSPFLSVLAICLWTIFLFVLIAFLGRFMFLLKLWDVKTIKIQSSGDLTVYASARKIEKKVKSLKRQFLGGEPSSMVKEKFPGLYKVLRPFYIFSYFELLFIFLIFVGEVVLAIFILFLKTDASATTFLNHVASCVYSIQFFVMLLLSIGLFFLNRYITCRTVKARLKGHTDVYIYDPANKQSKISLDERLGLKS